MSITLERPSAAVTCAWQEADPWLTAGIAALGELLVARGLCAANPASNGGDAYANAVFSLAPGAFRAADVHVRWNRHIGSSSMQSRPYPRERSAALLAACRASLSA